VSFGEVKFGVGREACKQYLLEHPETVKEIREKVLVVAKERQAEDDAGAKPAPLADEPTEEEKAE
jgi:hypothetical protein